MLIRSGSKLNRLLVAFLSLAWAPCAYADARITAVANTIQLKDNQTSGSVNLYVRIDGSKKEPTVRILSVSQAGPSVVAGKPTLEVDLQNGIFWKVPASITNLPLSSKVDVSLVVKIEETISDVLSYSITNTPVLPDADVNPSGAAVFTKDSRDLDFTVNLKGAPLRGLTVCRVALADANTGRPLPPRFLSLYLNGADSSVNPQVDTEYLTLVAPTSKVHLYISPDFKDYGVFTGSADLCAINKPSVSKLTFTVNSSSRCIKGLGALLILAGIVVYLLVTVFLKQRTLRLTALLPAARLTEALEDLETSAKEVATFAGVDLTVLLGKANHAHSLQSLMFQVSLGKLDKDGYLPPRFFSNPFSQADASAAYQQRLQVISAQQLNDAIIVGDGLQRVKSLWQMLDQENTRKALIALDDLATRADTADPIRTLVDAIVHDIPPREKELTERLTASHIGYRIGGEHTPTVQQVLFQIERVSVLGWLIWALLAFGIGCAALILNHHGFGTDQDLIKCFFWGIGIQATGQGLQSLNPSSAASTFSLQIGR